MRASVRSSTCDVKVLLGKWRGPYFKHCERVIAPVLVGHYVILEHIKCLGRIVNGVKLLHPEAVGPTQKRH